MSTDETALDELNRKIEQEAEAAKKAIADAEKEIAE